jgi:hypothetical protein
MESDTGYIIISITLLAHLIVAWRTQVFINSSRLNSFQKRVNSLLNWLIPFIWALVIKTMIRPPKNPVTIKKDRKTPQSGEGPGSISIAD